MAGVDTIVLDKTGTLTCADARGVEFMNAESGKRKAETGLTADEMDRIGSLARHSTHPKSVRIAKAFSFTVLPVAGFKETPGCGIEGEVAGHRILLGSPAWLAKCGISTGDKINDTMSVAVALDGSFPARSSLKIRCARKSRNLSRSLADGLNWRC
jgi:cation transport ATPase